MQLAAGPNLLGPAVFYAQHVLARSVTSEFRKQVFRNVRILGTIFLCFVCGIFAAETVGTWLEKKARQDDTEVEIQTTPVVDPPPSNEQLP